MKKYLFILTLTMSIWVNAEENKNSIILNAQEWTYDIDGKEYTADITSFRDREWTYEVDGEENKKMPVIEMVREEQKVPQTNLADSFMDAFGMKVKAGGGGGAAPGTGEGSSGTITTGISAISTSVINQVTPSFTPYSYK